MPNKNKEYLCMLLLKWPSCELTCLKGSLVKTTTYKSQSQSMRSSNGVLGLTGTFNNLRHG